MARSLRKKPLFYVCLPSHLLIKMRASSPLAGVQEEEWGRPHSPEGTDLWELASLDYPGREDGEMQYEVYDVGLFIYLSFYPSH